MKDSIETFLEKAINIHGDKYDYSEVKYRGSKTKVCIICPKHGEFWQTPNNHLRGKGCRKCGLNQVSLKRRKTNEEFIENAKEIHGDKYDYSKVLYTNSYTKVCIVCPKHGDFQQTPHEHLKGQGCPECKKDTLAKIHFDTKDSFIKKANKIHGNKYDYSNINYICTKEKLTINCPIHGDFEQTPRDHLQGCGCPKCGHINSKSENELYEFCCELFGKENVKQNDREKLEGKELDIYIPSKNIAIEFDGLRWHSEQFNNDKKYHLRKTQECEKLDIRLIHIFEDEWDLKKDICKSRLKSIFGLTERKLYARKCSLKEVSTEESTSFLNENHLQGTINAKFRYGLFNNEELVSLMCFGNKRKNLGLKAEEGVFEMLRFCNKKGVSVIGGASKLLKLFVKENKPNGIISYADRRWSEGILYERLGFNFNHYSQPNYFYIVNDRRENRFKYRKSELIKQGFDKEKTEHEIMLERGIYRIYDCGTKVFEYH